MSAIRSPAVRSPAHDDREKHARHRRADLIVVMARPSRILAPSDSRPGLSKGYAGSSPSSPVLPQGESGMRLQGQAEGKCRGFRPGSKLGAQVVRTTEAYIDNGALAPMFQLSPKSVLQPHIQKATPSRVSIGGLVERWYCVIEGWSNPRAWTILDARGRSPMCDRVASPLLGRGAGGRSPGYL